MVVMTSPAPTGRSVSELGEFGLIEAITAGLAGGPEVMLGPGDDAAVVAAPDGRVVASTDVLVEGVHFRRDWSEAGDVGHKAAAQNLSDLAAMGARPTALLVGLVLPPQLPAAWVLELSSALAAEAARAGASVVGGDLVAGDAIVVAVTALGSLDGRDPVTRAGARVGDAVAVRGRLGWSAAGYVVLSRGFRSPRVLAAAHRRPQPEYEAGPVAAQHGATSMMDVSDGLIADLAHVAAASGVGIRLDVAKIPVDAALTDAAAAMGKDPLEWALTGGEDHALVATFPAGLGPPAGWTVLGEVVAGDGVVVDGVPAGAYTGPGGWRHFSS